MVKSLIGTILVLRLQLRQLPLDVETVFGAWRNRPAIEIVLQRENPSRGKHLQQRLDQVYPF